ncbi:alpha/beta hydrolase [Lachnospiraceae bacterium C1.1]|nr:alpha/beta hydrolase fold domain-containing protein [Lachnospiraceae bacterium C1.1]
MADNYIIKMGIATKDALTAPIIKYYLAKNEIHLTKTEMEEKMRALKGNQEPYRLDRELIKGEVSSFRVDNFSCYTFMPREYKTDKHVIYFTGGAFFQEATKFHIQFMETLAKRAGVKVTMVAYPKVPTYDGFLTYKMAEVAYKKILEETDAKNIVVSGDSSGGAIALTLPQYFRDKGLPMPRGVVVYSPACSIKSNSPETQEYQKRDPMLILDAVKIPVKIWREGISDIVCDPMAIDPETLPHILVFTGTEDVLYPDTKNFVEKMHYAGKDIKCYIFKGMFHVFHLQYMTIAATECMKITCDYLRDL